MGKQKISSHYKPKGTVIAGLVFKDSKLRFVSDKNIKAPLHLIETLEKMMQEHFDDKEVFIKFENNIYENQGEYYSESNIKTNLDKDEIKVIELQIKRFFKSIKGV